MATAVATFVGTKAVDAQSIAGFSTGNADTDIHIEGGTSVGQKTSATTADFYDASIVGGPYNLNTSGDHIFGWFNTLTPASLHGIIAGTATSVWYWTVGPAATYAGGWTNYVIDPARSFDGSILAGSWTAGGNPGQLTAVTALGGRHTTSTSIMGNFNNALVDAFSVGSGYEIYEGSGGSADATFQDIVTYELNSANRFGALRSQSGILFMISKLIIGNASFATEFTDNAFTVVWADEPVAADFYELRLQASGSGTNVTMTNGILKAEDPNQAGKVTFTLTGADQADFTNVQFGGGLAWVGDAAVTADSCDIQSEVVTPGGAHILNSKIRTTSAANVASLTDPTFAATTDIHDTDFIQNGSGHAVVFTGNNLTINLTEINWSGYGATDTASSAIEFTGTGPHTVLFAGGNAPSVQTNGETVNVTAAVTVTITAKALGTGLPVVGARVYLAEDPGGATLVNDITDGTGVVSFAYNFASDQDVIGRVRSASGSPYYKTSDISGTITNAGFTSTQLMVLDE